MRQSRGEVLLLFLCYPTLVRLCLSMLKCKRVGETMYLWSDLQAECFGERHTPHLVLPALPAVLGLPLTSGLLILRNRRLLGDSQFKRR